MRNLVFLLVIAFSATVSAAAPVQVAADRFSDQPLLSPRPRTFYDAGTFNPAAARLPNGRVLLLTRGQNKAGLSQIGSALSTDTTGTRFTPSPDPSLSPLMPYERDRSGKHGGVEDPRLVKIGHTWYLTYTGYNGKDAQLCLATSTDLHNWHRHGVILPAYKGKWNTHWTKSGAIVPQKINGKWWMYYLGTRTLPEGETSDDQGGNTVDSMGLAWSYDLLHWKDATAEPVMPRRTNAFDSRVMEPGPAPIVTPAGILVFYNGADSRLVYRTGWALFSLNNPTKMIWRSDKPILEPTLPWEQNGQVPNVVFLEGAVSQQATPDYCSKEGFEVLGYYGAGDKTIGGAKMRIKLDCDKATQDE